MNMELMLCCLELSLNIYQLIYLLVDILTTSWSLCILNIYIPTCSIIMKPFNISKPLPSCYYTLGLALIMELPAFLLQLHYLPSHYYEPSPLTYITADPWIWILCSAAWHSHWISTSWYTRCLPVYTLTKCMLADILTTSWSLCTLTNIYITIYTLLFLFQHVH